VSRGYAFRPEAREELRDAVRYYEKVARGLGAEFSAEVRATIERLLLHPGAGPLFEAGTRRMHLVRFPYSIVYVQHQGRIEIVALMHHRRDPRYWMGRV
jgi:plasmid stabilization system protein ParE